MTEPPRNNPEGVLFGGLLTAAWLFGVAGAVLSGGGKWDDPLALGLLAAAMTWRWMRRRSGESSGCGAAVATVAAWGLLIAGAAAVWVIPPDAGRDGVRNCGLLLSVLAFGVRRFGAGALKLIPLLTLDFLILPFQEIVLLSAGYPLRLLSAFCTVVFLRLTGCGASWEQTSIFVGGDRLAITDACSGIGQLGVLLLISWLLLGGLRSAPWWRESLYFLCLLPVVIAANTVRLLITSWLFLLLGDRALEYDIHTILGYGFIALAVMLLWLVRRCFGDGCGRCGGEASGDELQK
ncbi:MAG: exosortase/archaeosortase family protein [Victivallaceae bacterium]|nr:exosortase/archaeosortase family protein [Victivallaceae bacterium]